MIRNRIRSNAAGEPNGAGAVFSNRRRVRDADRLKVELRTGIDAAGFSNRGRVRDYEKETISGSFAFPAR